jgi:Flp pilus assembly protein TadG
MSRLHRRERGSATVEMVVVAPGLIMIIGLLIMGGRIAIAGGSVEHAAAEAARAASIARTAAEAQASGDSTARMVLDNAGLQCVGAASVSIDTADFTTTQAGQPGEVSATVSCQVRLSDVAIPGLPGTRLMEHRASSPLDTYRTRQ